MKGIKGRKAEKCDAFCLFTLEEVRWDCEYKSQCRNKKNYFILRFNMEHSTRLKRCETFLFSYGRSTWFFVHGPTIIGIIYPTIAKFSSFHGDDCVCLRWKILLIFHIVLKITNLVFWDKLIILVINKILIYRLTIQEVTF